MVVRDRLTRLLQAAVASQVAPGAVLLAERDGERVAVQQGWVATHGADGRVLPGSERQPVSPWLRYDLASLTKVVSAITILRLVDEQMLAIDTPVAQWLPEFGSGDKRRVTLRMLLSHTAGLVPTWPDWQNYARARAQGTSEPSRAEVLGELLAVPLDTVPAQRLSYSCLGYITAGTVAERATGTRWDDLVRTRVLEPLGLQHTGYRPSDPVACAPTEFEPQWGRGMIRGVVHDETAWALHGISANAGLFATGEDVQLVGEAIARGLPGVLSESSWDLLWNDQLPRVLGPVRAAEEARRNGFRQSCGLRIGQLSFMGAHGEAARGHTGFTGTSLVIEADGTTVTTLLTNRVHPTREGVGVMPLRVAVAQAVRQGWER